VVDLLAKEGERIFRGQNLVVLESMKMESGVASPMDGVIAEVRVAVGQAVEVGEILIQFKSS
jgi:propionyl-CoA carboxylase alpha chain